MSEKVTVPSKTAGTPLEPGGLYLGIVRQVSGTQVFVELPLVSPGFAFGPCFVVANRASVTTTSSGGYLTSVTVTNTVPNVGDRVICAFLNNERTEIVVLGRVL